MIFSEIWRKARKSHRCCECGAEIVPGERYLDTRGADGARAWTMRQCLQCHALAIAMLATGEIPDGHWLGSLVDEVAGAESGSLGGNSEAARAFRARFIRASHQSQK